MPLQLSPHHPPLPSPTSSRHNTTNATTTATTPSRVRVVLKHHQGAFGIFTSRLRSVDINSHMVHWVFMEAPNKVRLVVKSHTKG
nr:hypothetical protein [Tanacetum cinerariifolium]